MPPPRAPNVVTTRTAPARDRRSRGSGTPLAGTVDVRLCRVRVLRGSGSALGEQGGVFDVEDFAASSHGARALLDDLDREIG